MAANKFFGGSFTHKILYVINFIVFRSRKVFSLFFRDLYRGILNDIIYVSKEKEELCSNKGTDILRNIFLNVLVVRKF